MRRRGVSSERRHSSHSSCNLHNRIFSSGGVLSLGMHRENSLVTQTNSDPTLLSWGSWPCENFSPTPGHAASPVLLPLSGHSDPIVLKHFDLSQVCHGNKICSKLALTWKLTLELSFPAHCILNWKLSGISRTNISKVTLNADTAVGASVEWQPPCWARRWGKIVQWSMKAWSRKPRRGDLPMVGTPAMGGITTARAFTSGQSTCWSGVVFEQGLSAFVTDIVTDW